MPAKVTLPWLRPGQQIGLGDAFKKVTDYFNIQPTADCHCEQWRQEWNQLVTFAGAPTPQPPQPKTRPTDWLQSYQGQQVDEESMPDGG